MQDESHARFQALVARSTDFDCLPRRAQIQQFGLFLIAEGWREFAPGDIAQLFERAALSSPRSGKLIRCSTGKIAGHLDALAVGGTLPIRKAAEDGSYRV